MRRRPTLLRDIGIVGTLLLVPAGASRMIGCATTCRPLRAIVECDEHGEAQSIHVTGMLALKIATVVRTRWNREGDDVSFQAWQGVPLLPSDRLGVDDRTAVSELPTGARFWLIDATGGRSPVPLGYEAHCRARAR